MKTIAQHKADGTYRKDRHGNRVELPPLTSLPSVSSTTLSDRAQEYYQQFGEVLVNQGILTDMDLIALEVLADRYATYKLSQEHLNEYGHVFNGKQSPYVSIQREAYKEVISIMRDFGMTPVSRTRIKKTDTKIDEDDPLRKLMAM